MAQDSKASTQSPAYRPRSSTTNPRYSSDGVVRGGVRSDEKSIINNAEKIIEWSATRLLKSAVCQWIARSLVHCQATSEVKDALFGPIEGRRCHLANGITRPAWQCHLDIRHPDHNRSRSGVILRGPIRCDVAYRETERLLPRFRVAIFKAKRTVSLGAFQGDTGNGVAPIPIGIAVVVLIKPSSSVLPTFLRSAADKSWRHNDDTD